MLEISRRSHLLEQPIPLKPARVDGWKQVEIQESGEPLVPLGPFSDYDYLNYDSIYFGERETSPYRPHSLKGGLITPFVRKGLAENLTRAQKLLPQGHVFLIWDAYRTVEVQRALFDHYQRKLAEQRPGLTDDELNKEVQRFVSLPSADPLKPSPHNTGGVVDLTIVSVPMSTWKEIQKRRRDLDVFDPLEWYRFEMEKVQIFREQARPLDMGTSFDSVGPETATNYYEWLMTQRPLTKSERSILLNRRFLFNALRTVGIENYEEEWWHFSFGDQMWTIKTGRQAIYGPAKMSSVNLNYEETMEAHYYGTIRRRREHLTPGDKIALAIDFEVEHFVRETTKSTGDPRFSAHPKAARI